MNEVRVVTKVAIVGSSVCAHDHLGLIFVLNSKLNGRVRMG